jgi:glyoxylase-like metal-dependent hydrolase (beta-lactamase superfamily II)
LNETDAIRVIGAPEVEFREPPNLKDVHTARLPIAGMAWVDTDDGVVLIDTLSRVDAAKQVLEKIKAPIKYIVYTHGHGDHVGGASVFLKDNPVIIASKYLPDRFEKYKILAPYRAHIGAVQFNTPEFQRRADYTYPTKTFLGDMRKLMMLFGFMFLR